MREVPPDNRLDGPIHGWFGLSYSNYLVLHRTLMQSMPVGWQTRAVALFDELDAAYAHLDKAQAYIVLPAQEVEYDSLTDRQMDDLGVTRGPEDDEGFVDTYYDRDGREHQSWERALVPAGDDPIPHYNRGRTYLPPADTRPEPGGVA